MKRDMLLCRELLLEIESWETSLGGRHISIPDYTDDEVGYNLHQLVDGGYIEATNISSHDDRVHRYMPSRLTSASHDWLDRARDAHRLRKAIKTIGEKGGDLSLGTVGAVLARWAQSALGL